ncbi:MAG: alpha/beta hydrolase [Bacillota bacterium]
MKGKKALFFETGTTTQFACQFDSRFSFCAYIPKSYDESKSDIYSLAVLVHGTYRNAHEYRDEFIDFADATNTIILAPLFPGGITEPWECDSYKFLKIKGNHFDRVLLAMVEEVSERYKITKDKFFLHGFSGGGQFVHRFFYFHPDRLLGVSIGAPGNVTYLDTTSPWYVGIGDCEERFGVVLDYEEMKRVPVLMVIGSEDTETWMINDKDAPFWMDGLDKRGNNRIERLRALRDNFEQNGIQVRYEEIPGVSHEGFKVVGVVKEFFSGLIG